MKISEIIAKLRDESKTNSKLKILKENSSNETLKYIFYITKPTRKITPFRVWLVHVFQFLTN